MLTIRGPQLWPIARYVVDTPHMITKYLECRCSVVVGGRLGDIGGVECDLGSASLLSTFNGVSAQPCASCSPGIESQIDDDFDDKRISSFLRGEDKHLAPAKIVALQHDHRVTRQLVPPTRNESGQTNWLVFSLAP